MTSKAALDVFWDGPFSWPTFESASLTRTVLQTPGVYLQTFEYNGGYLIYAAGLSRRTHDCSTHSSPNPFPEPPGISRHVDQR